MSLEQIEIKIEGHIMENQLAEILKRISLSWEEQKLTDVANE